MTTYIRAQVGRYTFEQMQNFTSGDGGDGCDELGGLCACRSVSALLSNTVMDALSPGDEIIVFKGYEVCEIYDGYRVIPTEEILRTSKEQFLADENLRDSIDEMLW